MKSEVPPAFELEKLLPPIEALVQVKVRGEAPAPPKLGFPKTLAPLYPNPIGFVVDFANIFNKNY